MAPVLRGKRIYLGPTRIMPIPQGSVIYCPGCGTGLFEVIQKIYQGAPRPDLHLESLTEAELSRRPFICSECSRLIVNSSGQYQYTEPHRSQKIPSRSVFAMA